ncbi:MAG: dihydropyrimidinase [Candidatus Dormibacteraeota bacterium]|nr:dihydropyrimidinase [Candidatus Dormibacteraeota bacterium]
MLIRGGTVVSEGRTSAADVRVRGQRIAAVDEHLASEPGEEVLEAAGLLVLPGLIDPHTHFGLDTGTGPTADDWSTGTASAAAGGVTTCINFATQFPGQGFAEALAAVRRQAEGRARIDWSLHLNITRLDDGWERELEQVVDQGVSSAKVYTTYKDAVFYVDDWTIYRLMQRSGPAGMLVQMHAENDDMLQGRRRELESAGKTSLAFHGEARPALAEAEAVSRGLFFSRVTGSPIYLVHLSNPLSVDLVTEARNAGIRALAETCPHFLCLNDSVYQRPDATRFLMTPPIRPEAMRSGLWERVSAGQVDTVGSDHCGYSLEQRGDTSGFAQVPNPGIPGVETTLPLMFTFGVKGGLIDLQQLVSLTSEGPARAFGLWPQKGRIAAGADADLVLFDPRRSGPLRDEDLHTAAGFSPFAGLTLQGGVKTTFCRGRLVFDRGRVLGAEGWGRFTERLPALPESGWSR